MKQLQERNESVSWHERIFSKPVVALVILIYSAFNYNRMNQQLVQVQTSFVDQIFQQTALIFQETATAKPPPPYKFFILAPPQLTSNLLQNSSSLASDYYKRALNEHSAELWLYRGVERLTYTEGRTYNATEADFFLLPGLVHFYAVWAHQNAADRSLFNFYKNMIIDPSKPHLLLTPAQNPEESRKLGVKGLVTNLQKMNVNLYSVGFERNPYWQQVSVDRIVSIPYVVRPSHLRNETIEKNRVTNFVFYAGDSRPHALQWAGCDRTKMIQPLKNETNMNVRIVGKRARLSQQEYNHMMSSSEYCLILCGDTPTSRSLTSAMVAGCIPIRVGSRLRGLCEPPCRQGWGWVTSGVDNPHLPYSDIIHWDQFPEVNESSFTTSGKEELAKLFQGYDDEAKTSLRDTMEKTRDAWLYGWGDPVYSEEFGDATTYMLNSFHKRLHPVDDR